MTARIAGLGAVLAVSVATVAGCGGSGSQPAARPASPPAPKTPADVLLASVPDEKSGPYHFAVTNSDGKLTGVVDAPRKAVSVGMTQKQAGVPVTMDMKFLILGTRTWVKVKFTPADVPGLPRMPSKWQLVDPSKIKDKDNGLFAYGDDQGDPGYAHEIVANAGTVERTSAGHYRGRTDLSLTGVGDIVDNDTVKALGAKAKSVPFTAVTDAKGRLTRLEVKIPAAGKAKAHTYAAVYDGYEGTATPAEPSTGEQQKAVPALYDMVNS